MRLERVSEWKCHPGAKAEYVFVSYTSRQFSQDEDFDYLHEVGKAAARAAGVNAYWVSCACLGDAANPAEIESNVWSIQDVLRCARSMVIAVSGKRRPSYAGDTLEDLLKEWGKSAWTLPEILLAPGGGSVNVYNEAHGLEYVKCIERRNFSTFWDDAEVSGQLVDHYEGSIHLTPLELQTIALECLHNRNSPEYLPGDMSYVLMGLLRQRPTVVRTDSAFQAFARLSLANDSSRLLERLICLLPKSTLDPWHWTRDQWDAKLWDIHPKCHICGIGEDDTIFLDNVKAAPIRWKSFAPVWVRQNETTVRATSRILVRLLPIYIAAGTLLAVAGFRWSFSELRVILLAFGGFFIGLSLTIALLLPYLVRVLYHGKAWGVQPWLFGLEGYMDLVSLEYLIFGENLGRLRWSAAGSRLSWHSNDPQRTNFCVGKDPYLWPSFKKRIQCARESGLGDEKVFTLVDTVTMTVTLFSAEKPPIAALICGEEGGMQRALLCSYEWESNTLFRETVLRMETPVYMKMQPVRKVKLGLRRKGASRAM